MSRIGKMLIEIPQGVTVTTAEGKVVVKGPKGTLTQELRPEVTVLIKDNTVTVALKEESKTESAYWGLTRALINNMVKGVTQSFEKKLELVGVGYRVKKSGNDLTISIGFSHPVNVKAPEGISFDVPDEKNIIIKGSDKQLVGLTASLIRKIREPEPYKGKGIKYFGEHIRRKAGKAGKA